jgi:hypothetical protein
LRKPPLMFGGAHGAMRLPQNLVGLDLRRRSRAPLCRVNATQLLCVWTTFPGARALGTSFSSMIGLSTYLKSSCLQRGEATKGLGWRLEVCRIRSGASRDRHEDVVYLDFMVLHCHLVVDVTAISARTNTNVPHIGARLPLPGGLALGAKHGKLDADLSTSALLGTPSV